MLKLQLFLILKKKKFASVIYIADEGFEKFVAGNQFTGHGSDVFYSNLFNN